VTSPAAELPALLRADARADRVVPPTGHTARLTVLASAAMAFLAVFALALAFSLDRLADRWEAELAGTATIRVSAPEGQVDAQVAAALRALGQTPGVADPRALTDDEQRALLAPWFGPDLPVDALPLPRLIEFREVAPGFDAEGLRLRLAAEAPGAVLDDHTRWRAPLIAAADRLRTLAVISLALMGVVVAALVTLAASSALASNAQVIEVLRLVGARDTYIARAFVRRFTIRAMLGAIAGTLAGLVAVFLLPSGPDDGGFLTGLGFRGAEWAIPLGLPLLVGLVAFAATRAAAFAALRRIR
jgi:cell division transport system permease protein